MNKNRESEQLIFVLPLLIFKIFVDNWKAQFQNAINMFVLNQN